MARNNNNAKKGPKVLYPFHVRSKECPFYLPLAIEHIEHCGLPEVTLHVYWHTAVQASGYGTDTGYEAGSQFPREVSMNFIFGKHNHNPSVSQPGAPVLPPRPPAARQRLATPGAADLEIFSPGRPCLE
ncbi:hypothetical protein Bbelb_372870 [Branchiostoma belcheri]|nr:hypothetical protein Bbelb_372870 [Branchiostoma belcheri]